MRKKLRGGWDTTPEEFQALGFTIGLPPNLYVPQTQEVKEVSYRFQQADSAFNQTKSNFPVFERQSLFNQNRIFSDLCEFSPSKY